MAQLGFLTGGDVAPDRQSGSEMFGEIAARFRRAGVAFVNLEGPLSGRGEPVRGKGICFRGAPASAQLLAESGLPCVNIANNHMLDFGESAFFDTIEHIERSSIGHFGGGRNLEEARKPFVIEKQGIRCGFLGYTTTLPAGYAASVSSAGVNPLQVYTAYQPRVSLLEYPGVTPTIVTWTDAAHLKQMREDITALSKRVDVVIVYVHWGSSMSPQVHDFQREIGKAAIDAGAHAVLGGHNHVLSAIEFHKARPIVYCSGNLVFDHRIPFFTRETHKTFLFGATVDTDGLRDCYLVPATTGVGEPPRLLTRHDPSWKEIVDDVQSMSQAYGTKLVPREDGIAVQPGADAPAA